MILYLAAINPSLVWTIIIAVLATVGLAAISAMLLKWHTYKIAQALATDGAIGEERIVVDAPMLHIVLQKVKENEVEILYNGKLLETLEYYD